MTEKLVTFLKKYYPVILIILILIGCILISKNPKSEPEVKANDTVHTLATETYTTETPTESETETKTEAATEPETSEPPEEMLLEDVPYYSQRNILPTGCEIMSAKMLLEYYTNQETELQDMIDVIACQYPEEKNNRLYGPHPSNIFLGSPWDESGFGCYAPVIVRMLNHLLPENYQAIETTGTDLQELAETYLPQNTPVLIWATINMQKSVPTMGWYLYNQQGYATDEWFQWLANEHCMVLVGYDSDNYYFNDPYENHGTITFGKDISAKRYEEIGGYSLIIQEKPE